METSKMKAILIDKETGKRTELPGAIGTIQMSNFEPKEQENRLHSYEAKVNIKVRISRRKMRKMQRLFAPPKEPKYISKAQVARTILAEDPNNTKTFAELLQHTRKQLGLLSIPALINMIGKEWESEMRFLKRMSERVERTAPIAGIVPSQDIRPNTGEMIICPQKAQKMRVELMPELAKIEKPSIDIFEIVRKASERRGLEIPEIQPDKEELKFERIKLDDQNPN